jgi:hypothetical protein
MSKEHDEMKLPEGKTCGHCAHFGKCRQLVGSKEDWTSCDFLPRRFVMDYKTLGLEALKKAKRTIRAWHGDLGWDIYDHNSPEMKFINSAIDDFSK